MSKCLKCNDNRLTSQRIHFIYLILPLTPEFGTMSSAKKLQVLLNLINVESNSPLLGLICKLVMKIKNDTRKIVIPLKEQTHVICYSNQNPVALFFCICIYSSVLIVIIFCIFISFGESVTFSWTIKVSYSYLLLLFLLFDCSFVTSMELITIREPFS